MSTKSKAETKAHHIIALTFALLFHVAAIYALTGNTNVEYDKFVPEFAKEWFDKDADKKDTKAQKRA